MFRIKGAIKGENYHKTASNRIKMKVFAPQFHYYGSIFIPIPHNRIREKRGNG